MSLDKLSRLYQSLKQESSFFTRWLVIAEPEAGAFNRQFTQKISYDGKVDDRFETGLEHELVNFIISHITTTDQYTRFEDQVLRLQKFHDLTHPKSTVDVLYPRDVIDALRQHGKKLFGVDRLEQHIEQRFGFQIETEHLFSFGCEYVMLRGAMHFLKKSMEGLEVMLDFLPRELRQNAVLRTIYLTSPGSIVMKETLTDKNPGTRSMGGVALPGCLIYDGGTQVFFHEFFHCLDMADGLLGNDVSYILGSYSPEDAIKLSLKFILNKLDSLMSSDDQSQSKKGAKKGGKKERPPGFSSRYGYDNFMKWGLFTEDQADLAGNAIAGSLMVKLKNDQVLEKKILWLRDFLFKKSDGLMDAQFWREYLSDQNMSHFGANYWEKKRQARAPQNK